MEVISDQYWCHSCHNEFSSLPAMHCPSCESEFIELLEADEPHPRTLLATPQQAQSNAERSGSGNRVVMQVVSRGSLYNPLFRNSQLPTSLDDPLAALNGHTTFQALLANFLQLSENEGAPPATSTEIALLDEITADEIAQGERNCPICQEDITETGKLLPCKHAYHAPCIMQWLHMHNTCPSCRTAINDNVS